jgi:hypothetical protein
MTRASLIREIQSIALVTAFFFAFLFILAGLKELALAEYDIRFHGMMKALVGALILAKVVLILEKVPLPTRNWPALGEVLLRTFVFAIGVVAVLLVEKGFETRHEAGGFLPAMTKVFDHPEIHHVWINAIVVALSLLAFNLIHVLRRHLGTRGLFRLFLSPLPSEEKREETNT